MKARQCGNCGNKTMQLQNVKGPFPWKDFSAVSLLEPIELLKCSTCGELGYRPKDTETIDRGVEATIRALTEKFIETIISREKCSQLNLAQRIGITPEYLSVIKNGTRTPGFQTFNMLKILVEEPSAFAASDPGFNIDDIISEVRVESYREVLRKLA